MSTHPLQALLRRRHWVFDLDGTLTVPVHNFSKVPRLAREEGVLNLEADRKFDFWLCEQIKQKLGVPIDQDILTYIDQQPGPESARLHEQVACLGVGVESHSFFFFFFFFFFLSFFSSSDHIFVARRGRDYACQGTTSECWLP
jgi:hypothetical protein